MKTNYLALLLILILILGCKSEYKEGDISYNLEKSDSLPQLFLPWIVNTSAFEMNASFSKSGKEFYYSVADPYQNYNAIVSVKQGESIWGNPEVVSFSGVYSDFDPFLTHDENRLYFCSRRPLQEGIDKTNDANIWFVQKDNDGWEEPQALNNINSEYDEYYVSVSQKGAIYFSSTRPGGIGSWDIYFSQDQDSTVKNIGEPVNSAYREWDPFIAEDESFIIFTSDRARGFGGGDLYISFKNDNGEWSNPINLGNKINTSDYEYCPAISRDMEYLYFSRFGGSSVDFNTGSKKSLMQLTNKFKSIENGLGNIYRIKLKDLEVFERRK